MLFFHYTYLHLYWRYIPLRIKFISNRDSLHAAVIIKEYAEIFPNVIPLINAVQLRQAVDVLLLIMISWENFEKSKEYFMIYNEIVVQIIYRTRDMGTREYAWN